MSTKRERIQRRVEQRREWAGSARRRGNAKLGAADQLAGMIPMGQPILVGHHSEGRARRDQARIQHNTRAGLDELTKAKDHSSTADELERQLDRSIYSDDPDAPEALQARVAALETAHERMKATNTAYKRRDAQKLAELGAPTLESLDASLAEAYSWCKAPFPGYALSNSSANIRRLRLRLQDVQQRRARTEQAESSGGVSIEGTGDYCRVTFAEKPERSVLGALKAAGFRWGQGSWSGRRAELPADVEALGAL